MPATAERPRRAPAPTTVRPAAPTPTQQLAGLVRDPVRFARGLLRYDPWGTQEAILRSVATHPRTAVKACHASGKTSVAARAVQWWVSRYSDGIVVTTAPTWTQVEKLLWGEIHKSTALGRIAFPPLNKTELPIGPENYALGLSTNEGVRFQGWHGRILIVLDEAPGVLPEIYEAIEGIRAGGDVRVLALGNPTLASGPFYDAHTSQRATWNTFTISAFDTPNFAGVSLARLLAMSPAELAVAPRPYLVTRKWVREKYDEWGEAHPLWQSKVLGNFPDQADDALLSLAWLEAAKARPVEDDGGPVTVGIDVAGPGEDETVVSIRQGAKRLALHAFADADARGPVRRVLAPWKPRVAVVNYDEIGQGHYFGLDLADAGYPVRGVNVGSTDGVDTERFANWKAQLYWNLRDLAQTSAFAGITDEKELGQLAGVRWGTNHRGQTVIESKDEARKRGVKSPDRAEADMLAFAPPLPPPHAFDRPDPSPRRFAFVTH